MEMIPLSEPTEGPLSQMLPTADSKAVAPKEDGTAQQIMQLLQEIQNPQGAPRPPPFLGDNPCIPFFYRPDEQDEVKILVVWGAAHVIHHEWVSERAISVWVCVRVCLQLRVTGCLEVWGIINKHCSSPCLQLLIPKNFKAQFHQDATSFPFSPPMCAHMWFCFGFSTIDGLPKKRKNPSNRLFSLPRLCLWLPVLCLIS